MKTKNLFRIVIVTILTFTLPIPQLYAVVPDPHSALSDVAEKISEEIEILGSDAQQSEGIETNAATPDDPLKPATIVPSDILAEETPAVDDQELDLVPTTDEDHHFWTRGKVLVITTSVILTTTGLILGLLLLLGGGGGGSGSGGGAGGGGGSGGGAIVPPIGFDIAGGPEDGLVPGTILGGGLVPGTIPGGNIPHHPEPSTFLLMGLGLLIPFLRKRHS